jgi:hypothetical protein
LHLRRSKFLLGPHYPPSSSFAFWNLSKISHEWFQVLVLIRIDLLATAGCLAHRLIDQAQPIYKFGAETANLMGTPAQLLCKVLTTPGPGQISANLRAWP